MKKIKFFFLALILWQCARVSQPSGGPKDTEAPTLVASTPFNGQKNFKGRDIELTFSEFIKLKNAEDEIVITPALAGRLKFSVKRNKLIITPPTKWQDTTTYSVAFREGIQDINEGNPTEDLHLAFSTGPTIDSLKLSGSVTELFKEGIPTKITVAIYQSDTFDIFKHRPVFFTKTNKQGIFTIQNLKAGKYFVYAFDDKNKNSRIDSQSERFGYKVDTVFLPGKNDSIKIELIRVDARPLKLTSVRNTSTISTIRFNKQVDSVFLRTETPIIYTYGTDHSELIVYKEIKGSDSLKVNVIASDSVANRIDTAVYIKFTDSKIVNDKFKMSQWQYTFDVPTKTITMSATTNTLFASANYDSMYIQIDSTQFQPIKENDIAFDTLNRTIQIQTKLNIAVNEETLNPVVLFGKGAFVTVNKDSTKATDLKINIPKIKETGILSVEVNTDEKNFEVQLIDSKGKKVAAFTNQKKYTFSYLQPAEYKLLVIIDKNNNRRWDVGSFNLKQLPEKVLLYKNSENKTAFPIRANWEVGPLVISF
ncbi:MAG: Ig-like domain-containing protein [Bacteroidetes bacterium]|nr:Ig-like domain-containing protein [Bacteroidota bacterium]